MARKAEGRRQGQITPRGRDRWLIRVFIGRDAGGKRRYSAKTVKGTYNVAQRYLTKQLRDIDTRSFVEPSSQRLGDYLLGWLETSVKPRVSPSTLRGYRARLTQYVVPSLGHLKLDQLTPQLVQGVYAKLSERGLAPRTVEYTHTVLKQALKQAVAWNLLVRNPAEHVNLPRKGRNEMRALTAEQVSALLKATSGDPLFPLWVLLLTAGLRPGEALGLKWSDLTADSLRVQRALVEAEDGSWNFDEPKTEKSRRTVSLAQDTLTTLRAHRAVQLEQILARGTRYERNDLIFANDVGHPLDLSAVRRRWKAALKRAHLPAFRLYDTRHTHATMLLGAGINPKIVSERLGHSTIVLTLDTYSHVLPNMQEEVAGKVQSIVFDRAALG